MAQRRESVVTKPDFAVPEAMIERIEAKIEELKNDLTVRGWMTGVGMVALLKAREYLGI